jgi:hypothetical protein
MEFLYQTVGIFYNCFRRGTVTDRLSIDISLARWGKSQERPARLLLPNKVVSFECCGENLIVFEFISGVVCLYKGLDRSTGTFNGVRTD